MEANEAPEKIYINPLPNPSDGYVGIAWDEPHKTMVEYIRTDTIIEKAVSYIQQNWIWNTKIIEDFKKYMKGE